MLRVAGIEPASLAWKARGYSRRWLIFFNDKTYEHAPDMGQALMSTLNYPCG
jgi:hypothetical protein